MIILETVLFVIFSRHLCTVRQINIACLNINLSLFIIQNIQKNDNLILSKRQYLSAALYKKKKRKKKKHTKNELRKQDRKRQRQRKKNFPFALSPFTLIISIESKKKKGNKKKIKTSPSVTLQYLFLSIF